MARKESALTNPGAHQTRTSRTSRYTADDIQILTDMEAVRSRPAMYIGSTGESGLQHLLDEVLDNSLNESLAGFATRIDVTIHADNSVTFVDNGRGIPVDEMIFLGEQVPFAQVVMTRLRVGRQTSLKLSDC